MKACGQLDCTFSLVIYYLQFKYNFFVLPGGYHARPMFVVTSVVNEELQIVWVIARLLSFQEQDHKTWQSYEKKCDKCLLAIDLPTVH